MAAITKRRADDTWTVLGPHTRTGVGRSPIRVIRRDPIPPVQLVPVVNRAFARRYYKATAQSVVA
jgi:hypothetical protein